MMSCFMWWLLQLCELTPPGSVERALRDSPEFRKLYMDTRDWYVNRRLELRGAKWAKRQLNKFEKEIDEFQEDIDYVEEQASALQDVLLRQADEKS